MDFDRAAEMLLKNEMREYNANGEPARQGEGGYDVPRSAPTASHPTQGVGSGYPAGPRGPREGDQGRAYGPYYGRSHAPMHGQGHEYYERYPPQHAGPMPPPYGSRGGYPHQGRAGMSAHPYPAQQQPHDEQERYHGAPQHVHPGRFSDMLMSNDGPHGGNAVQGHAAFSSQKADDGFATPGMSPWPIQMDGAAEAEMQGGGEGAGTFLDDPFKALLDGKTLKKLKKFFLDDNGAPNPLKADEFLATNGLDGITGSPTYQEIYEIYKNPNRLKMLDLVWCSLTVVGAHLQMNPDSKAVNKCIFRLASEYRMRVKELKDINAPQADFRHLKDMTLKVLKDLVGPVRFFRMQLTYTNYFMRLAIFELNMVRGRGAPVTPKQDKVKRSMMWAYLLTSAALKKAEDKPETKLKVQYQAMKTLFKYLGPKMWDCIWQGVVVLFITKKEKQEISVRHAANSAQAPMVANMFDPMPSELRASDPHATGGAPNHLEQQRSMSLQDRFNAAQKGAASKGKAAAMPEGWAPGASQGGQSPANAGPSNFGLPAQFEIPSLDELTAMGNGGDGDAQDPQHRIRTARKRPTEGAEEDSQDSQAAQAAPKKRRVRTRTPKEPKERYLDALLSEKAKPAVSKTTKQKQLEKSSKEATSKLTSKADEQAGVKEEEGSLSPLSPASDQTTFGKAASVNELKHSITKATMSAKLSTQLVQEAAANYNLTIDAGAVDTISEAIDAHLLQLLKKAKQVAVQSKVVAAVKERVRKVRVVSEPKMEVSRIYKRERQIKEKKDLAEKEELLRSKGDPKDEHKAAKAKALRAKEDDARAAGEANAALAALGGVSNTQAKWNKWNKKEGKKSMANVGKEDAKEGKRGAKEGKEGEVAKVGEKMTEKVASVNKPVQKGELAASKKEEASKGAEEGAEEVDDKLSQFHRLKLASQDLLLAMRMKANTAKSFNVI